MKELLTFRKSIPTQFSRLRYFLHGKRPTGKLSFFPAFVGQKLTLAQQARMGFSCNWHEDREFYSVSTCKYTC
jgi:hypothetical protein